jgi:hypothetical protein
VGVAFKQAASHGARDTIGIAQNLIVPKADHAIAFCLDHSCSYLIPSPAVLASINLDHKSSPMAAKIDDEIADRHLPSEPGLWKAFA